MNRDDKLLAEAYQNIKRVKDGYKICPEWEDTGEDPLSGAGTLDDDQECTTCGGSGQIKKTKKVTIESNRSIYPKSARNGKKSPIKEGYGKYPEPKKANTSGAKTGPGITTRWSSSETFVHTGLGSFNVGSPGNAQGITNAHNREIFEPKMDIEPEKEDPMGLLRTGRAVRNLIDRGE